MVNLASMIATLTADHSLQQGGQRTLGTALPSVARDDELSVDFMRAGWEPDSMAVGCLPG